MTRREMFEAIVNGNITEEVVAMAQNEIVKMDERNAKRKNTPSKTALANEPIKARIVEVLTDEPMTASEVGPDSYGSKGQGKGKGQGLRTRIESFQKKEVYGLPFLFAFFDV